MYVLVTNKNEEDQIKNEGARVVTTLTYIIHLYFRCSRAANSKVGCGVWAKFKSIQVFMVALVTCLNEDDPFQNEGARVVTTFLSFVSPWGFSQTLKGI